MLKALRPARSRTTPSQMESGTVRAWCACGWAPRSAVPDDPRINTDADFSENQPYLPGRAAPPDDPRTESVLAARMLTRLVIAHRGKCRWKSITASVPSPP